MYRTGTRSYYILAIAIVVVTWALVVATLGGANRADAAQPSTASVATVSAHSALAFAPPIATPRITMRVDGVDGDSNLAGFDGWIDVLSAKWSGARQQDGRRGSVEVADFSIAMKYERASTELTEATLIGKVFPRIEIEHSKVVDGTRVTYLRYELKNVLVTSFDTSAAKRPRDKYSLNFEEITATYTEYDETGTKTGNWTYSWKVEEQL
ncbi:MAG: type VI secretion system tube protein Hcp [bacterium]|nr:type VI secretion system tube protein Hcp [bacterium]